MSYSSNDFLMIDIYNISIYVYIYLSIYLSIYISIYIAFYHLKRNLISIKGPYIKYVGAGGEGRRVFVGVIKYFRHILMGHEKFFKIFDGPQNIFLGSVFIILFFKLRGWSTKYPN